MTLTNNSRWGSSVWQLGETHCMALLAGQSSCFLCLLGRLFLISLCNFHVLIDRRLLTMQFSISVVLILWSVQLVNFIFTLKKHALRRKANSHLCQISPFTKILGFCYLQKIMIFQHYGWEKKLVVKILASVGKSVWGNSQTLTLSNLLRQNYVNTLSDSTLHSCIFKENNYLQG